MFITCQECNTTFRLDERLLKPAGSKVRCSQCQNMFIAYPLAPQPAKASAIGVRSMESPPAPPVPSGSSKAGEQLLAGIDLAELDSILEKKPEIGDIALAENEFELESAEETGGQSEEIDLDFDFDAALETAEAEIEPAAAGADNPDDLDLEMDFELDDGEAPLAEETAEAEPEIAFDLAQEDESPALSGQSDVVDRASAAAEIELALSDPDMGAEHEEPAAAPAPAKAANKGGLDLSDLDFDLDEESPGPEEDSLGAEGGEPELSLADEPEPALDELDAHAEASAENDAADEMPFDLDLELGEIDLETDAETEQRAETIEPEKHEGDGNGFDLSDLDSLLDMPEDEGRGIGEEPQEQDLELDFEEKKSAAEPLEKDVEELSFELDAEFEDKQQSKAAPADESPIEKDEEDEIDLSDIEQMLESNSAARPRPELKSGAGQKELDLGEIGEIDLKDIETAIDETMGVPDMTSEEEPEDGELELDLKFELSEPNATSGAGKQLTEIELPSQGTTSEPVELDLELEFENDIRTTGSAPVEPDENELDLSDLSDLIEDKDHAIKTETIDTGEIELEFQIEDEGQPAPAAATTGRKTAQSTVEFEESILAAPPVAKPAAAPKPRKKKKGSSKTLVFLLIVLLLAAIGGGVYYAVTEMGIEIPYLSEYLKPTPKDPAGVLNLSTLEINSKFIDNAQSGRLFLITGKVRNGYSMTRAMVRLQGKLFAKNRVLVKTESTFAGITINEQDLASLPVAEIQQRLKTVDQAQDATTAIRPGQNMPFMLVFADLPATDQLDEFAVDLVSSMPAK